MLCNHRTAGFDQAVVAGDDLGSGVRRTHFSQHRTRSSHAQRVAVVGAEVHDATVGDFIHIFALATKRAKRQAATD